MIKHMPVKDSGHKHSIGASEGEDHPKQEHEAVQQQANIVAIVHVKEGIRYQYLSINSSWEKLAMKMMKVMMASTEYSFWSVLVPRRAFSMSIIPAATASCLPAFFPMACLSLWPRLSPSAPALLVTVIKAATASWSL